MITNEDKAIEILRGKKFSIIGNFSYNDAFDAIIEMAEWKDFQFKYAIKDYIANCKKVGDYESAAALEDFYKQFKTE